MIVLAVICQVVLISPLSWLFVKHSSFIPINGQTSLKLDAIHCIVISLSLLSFSNT